MLLCSCMEYSMTTQVRTAQVWCRGGTGQAYERAGSGVGGKKGHSESLHDRSLILQARVMLHTFPYPSMPFSSTRSLFSTGPPTHTLVNVHEEKGFYSRNRVEWGVVKVVTESKPVPHLTLTFQCAPLCRKSTQSRKRARLNRWPWSMFPNPCLGRIYEPGFKFRAFCDTAPGLVVLASRRRFVLSS